MDLKTGNVRAISTLARGGLLAFAVVMLQGCAGSAPFYGSPEEIVRARAEARWKAIIASDWARAYGFSTPAFRQSVSMDGFLNIVRSSAARTGAKVMGVECAGTACDVTVKVDFKTPLLKGTALDTDVRERWVEVDNQWFFYQK